MVVNSHREDVNVWLSVSWAPVFDYYHEGLGHGDRYDALFLELVNVDPVIDANLPGSSPIISVKEGHKARVLLRKFFALVACEDDDLESVLRCVRKTTPNIFLMDRIVWGLGFIRDTEKYQEIENDWNADPAYTGHGVLPPRFEDDSDAYEDYTADDIQHDESNTGKSPFNRPGKTVESLYDARKEAVQVN